MTLNILNTTKIPNQIIERVIDFVKRHADKGCKNLTPDGIHFYDFNGIKAAAGFVSHIWNVELKDTDFGTNREYSCLFRAENRTYSLSFCNNRAYVFEK